VCGNCIDDDGNGLVDLEDPACCAEPTIAPLALRAFRFRGRADGPAVKIVARLDPLGLTELAPSTRTLFLQIGPDGDDPLVCSTIDASLFRATRRRLRFSDRDAEILEADGIGRVRIRARRNGRVTLKAIGRRLAFRTPEPGDYRVIVGVQDFAQGDLEPRCLGSLEHLEAVRGGLLLR